MKPTPLPLFALPAIVALAFVSTSAQEPAAPKADLATRATEDLKKFYTDTRHNPPPPYQKAIDQLDDDNEAVRTDAGEYVNALLKQAYADEINGSAPSQSLPFWGGGVENSAIELRKHISGSLGKAKGSDAGLDAAEWLIGKDPVTGDQFNGIKFVCSTKTQRADAIIQSVLAGPHHNPEVLLAAIKEAVARKLPVAPEITRLCGSYRSAIRDAARDAASQLGIKDIPAYKPEEAFTPWLDEQIRGFAAMIYPDIPKDAKWMRFTFHNDQQHFLHTNMSGWALGEKDGKLRMLGYFGNYLEVDAGDVTTGPRAFSEDAALFAEARTATGKPDDWNKRAVVFSEMGGLTGQFEPPFISAPEALVAAWSYQQGDKKLAASILFPRIDASPDDVVFVSAVRELVGKVYHQQMLDAFCDKHDYDQALRLAKHLSQPVFDGYFYQPRAKELAAQLEKRGDDFKTFTLPSAAEWDKQKTGMSRTAQIEFLAAHLRLLHCVQWGQPGGVSYSDPQYLKPLREYKGTPETVVNPFNELHAMNMTVGELASLVPFLADEDFMPTYSYWRNFHPGRTLHRVNWAVAELVNETAGRDLADLEKFGTLSAGEKKRSIEQTVQWCRDNAGKSRETRLLETLASTKDEQEFNRIASEAVELKLTAAAPVMAKRMMDFKAWQFRGRILEYCYELNTPEVVPFARDWLAKNPQEHPEGWLGDDEIGFWAVMLVLRDSKENPPEGLNAMNILLRKSDADDDRYVQSFELLVSLKNEAANRVACLYLEKIKKTHDIGKDELVKRLFLMGRQEAMDFISSGLVDATQTGTSSMNDGRQINWLMSDKVASMISKWRTDGYQYDIAWPEDRRTEEKQKLKKWADEQFALIKGGKPPAITKPRKLTGNHAFLDAP